jgi:hypothetical protein
MTYKNKFQVQVADVVSTNQISAYLAFNQKTHDQNFAPDKQGNSV